METTWMLFEREDKKALYFWNGEFPILVKYSGDIKDYYWNGIPANKMTAAQADNLNDLMVSRTKKFKRKSIQYIILARGSWKPN